MYRPPEDPERDLTEAETLKALDLLHAMRRRVEMMCALMTNPGAGGMLHSLEERLDEHKSLTGELQDVIRAAWGEDEP